MSSPVALLAVGEEAGTGCEVRKRSSGHPALSQPRVLQHDTGCEGFAAPFREGAPYVFVKNDIFGAFREGAS